MMRALAVIVVLAGCGRLGFESRIAADAADDSVTDAHDAATDAAPDAPPDIAVAPCMGATHQVFPAATYDDAITTCAAFGGSLVTIDDQAENDHVQSLINAQVWIGYNDRAAEGTFEWVGPPGTGYTNWVNGQPNDGGGGTTEDCGAMRTTGQWSDEDCLTEMFELVCQCP